MLSARRERPILHAHLPPGPMRVAPLVLALLLSCAASAQTFRPAGGPWTRDHALVGSAPDGRIFAAVGPRLGVTADGGRTWTVVAETGAPRRLVADVDALLGAFATGVRRSTDGGATWTPWGLDGVDVLDIAVDANVAYAVTERVIYRRGGAGVWSPVVIPVPEPVSGSRFRFVATGGGAVVVAAHRYVCQGQPAGDLYRSRDGGDTWARTGAGAAAAALVVGPDGAAYAASRDGQNCIGLLSPGSLQRLEAGADVVTVLRSGDFGGVALDASDAPVTALTGPGGPGSHGRIVIAGTHAVAKSSFFFGECSPDPPCGVRYDSGLYAALDGRQTPTGFVRSPVRTLAVVRDTLAIAADGAVFRPDATGVALWTELGNVRAFAEVPGEPMRTFAVSPLEFNGYLEPGT